MAVVLVSKVCPHSLSANIRKIDVCADLLQHRLEQRNSGENGFPSVKKKSSINQNTAALQCLLMDKRMSKDNVWAVGNPCRTYLEENVSNVGNVLLLEADFSFTAPSGAHA